MAKDFSFTNMFGDALYLKDRPDAIVHVATIGEGHYETVTWNSERAAPRKNHAQKKRRRYG